MRVLVLAGLLTLSSTSSIFDILISNICISSPPSIRNGVVIPSGRTYRGISFSTAIYRCNACYELVGLSTVYCTNGRWPTFIPTCTEKNLCYPNPCGRNAKCSRISFCRASCRCKHGYSGNPRRACEKACKQPYGINNAEFSPDKSFTGLVLYPYDEGDVITWRCENGFFEYSGRNQLTQRCFYGIWFGSTPTCLESVCSPPDAPENGRVSPSSRPGWRNGNVATYSCNDGYQLDGNRQLICSSRNSFSSPPFCVDVDECSMNTHNCSNTSTCANTEGSYMCLCERGYGRDGKSCTDIDECFEETAACSVYAQCQNTIGSYNCICREGFSGDGFTCLDVRRSTEIEGSAETEGSA